jgi:excisionase family DNA binding protein
MTTIKTSGDALTVRKACERLKISRRHLMHLIATGKLPGSYKLGLLRFIPRESVERRGREVEVWRARHARK